jgi:hypothetical protein
VVLLGDLSSQYHKRAQNEGYLARRSAAMRDLALSKAHDASLRGAEVEQFRYEEEAARHGRGASYHRALRDKYEYACEHPWWPPGPDGRSPRAAFQTLPPERPVPSGGPAPRPGRRTLIPPGGLLEVQGRTR